MVVEILSPSQTQGVPLPTNSAERITVLAHFHRAEIGRMGSWRDRIDRTSNWAITVVAAMLSVSLSTPSAHHGVLLFAMLLVFLLLRIEARRYRFFDVYRARVRQFERHYFAQIFSPAADYASNWQQILGENLREPRFRISLADAFARRLRRNYVWMFLILLLAWALKISTPTLQQERASGKLVPSIAELINNASLGPIPGIAIIVLMACFFGYLAYCYFKPFEDADEAGYSEVHV
jgi:uncharacterized membrane protein